MKRCSLNRSPIIVFVWFDQYTCTTRIVSDLQGILGGTDLRAIPLTTVFSWNAPIFKCVSISITPVFMMMFISLQTVEDLYIQHGVMVLEPYRFIYFPNMKLHFTDMYFVYLIIMFLITYCHLYVCVIIGLIFFSLCSLSHRSKILCFPFCP